MKKEVLNILRCPNCKQTLELTEHKIVDDEVMDGTLKCNNCQNSFKVSHGVPRMIVDLADRKQIAESFGFLWARKAENKLEIDTLYGETEEEEINSFFHCMSITPDDLKGKVILDAGCGCGRLTRTIGQFGAEVFGIDISSSIENVYEYCKPHNNVNIVQTDVLNLPFKEESFDYVWSDMAICYSKETKHAFDNLCEVLKPSGKLFVRVYSKTDQSLVTRMRDFLKISHIIPRPILFYLCFILALPSSLLKTVLRKRAPSFKSNVVILFNILSPQFINRHTKEEVGGWFKEKGFYDINIVSIPDKGVPIRGTKK